MKHSSDFYIPSSASSCRTDPNNLKVTQNAYFSLLTHTKQLFLLTFFDRTTGNGASFLTEKDGKTDVEVEIFIK